MTREAAIFCLQVVAIVDGNFTLVPPISLYIIKWAVRKRGEEKKRIYGLSAVDFFFFLILSLVINLLLFFFFFSFKTDLFGVRVNMRHILCCIFAHPAHIAHIYSTH